MDKERIARIIYNDVRLIDDPSAKAVLERCVRRAYTFGSLHRNMKKQMFDDEVAMTVGAILYDINADRRYQSLRSAMDWVSREKERTSR